MGAGAAEQRHIPVMIRETLEFIGPHKCGVYLDATIGCGGHTAAILESTGGACTVIGIDQDARALEIAGERLKRYGNCVLLIRDNFRRLEQILEKLQVKMLDGALFDLGVSSLQLDQKERGFCYQYEAPLDMRMDPSNPFTAAHIVNTAPEKELAFIIGEYGEERWAGRIASFIAEKRLYRPISSTTELVEIIKNAIPASARRHGPHPARRTFQALRIAVNDEIGIIKESLEKAVRYLAPGSRLAVISFHSLEDRQVKECFAGLAKPCRCPAFVPVCQCGNKPQVKILTKKPLIPAGKEVAENPRSRSAKMRVAEKL
ncbi:MAG: 16S rRNA (cytosine(1402)-N(4))-methyltransferase RsmH [Bacillota bacterium]